MPTAWTRLMDLKPSSFRTNVKLRLIRVYDLISFRNAGEVYARECIFHDAEGNRVLAYFQKVDFPLFNPPLKEGRLFRVSNATVESNSKPNLASFKFKLSFGKKTIIAETFDGSFPQNAFHFKPFAEINQITDFENTPLFDLIGAVFLEEPAGYKPIGGKDTLLMDIYLEDLEGTRVAFTLWEDYATKLMSYVAKCPKHPVVVLVQLCRASKFKSIIKASTYFKVSKLFIDDNTPEIQSFKERYSSKSQFLNNTVSFGTSSSSLQSTPSTIKTRTIEDVIQRKEPGKFWVCGFVASVENSGSWTYTSCKGCPRKTCSSESATPCSVCKAEGVVLRYRLKLNVVDDTGNFCLVLWDKHCIRIFGKKTEELMRKNENMGELPVEIEELLERKMMFQIEVSKSQDSLYEDTFSVNQVSIDPTFIEKYSFQTPNTQESVTQAKNKSTLMEEAGLSSTDKSPG